MKRKIRLVMQLILAGAGALALCTGAQAAFVSYSGSGNTTFLSLTSPTIDLGFVSSNYTARDTLGLTVSPEFDTSVTLEGHANLQVVQGCLLAAGSCGGSSWFDIPALGIGTPFSAPGGTTTTTNFDSGSQTLTTPAARSFRVLLSADLAPQAQIGASGTLSVVAVPEPETWAILLAGMTLVVGIARRRLS